MSPDPKGVKVGPLKFQVNSVVAPYFCTLLVAVYSNIVPLLNVIVLYMKLLVKSVHNIVSPLVNVRVLFVSSPASVQGSGTTTVSGSYSNSLLSLALMGAVSVDSKVPKHPLVVLPSPTKVLKSLKKLLTVY